MDVYIECIYIINGTLLFLAFLFTSILLDVYWSLGKLIKMSVLCNMSVVALYADVSWLLLFYWIGVFTFLFHCQFFLCFPVFLIVYFSILYFMNTLLVESYIYAFFLIAPMQWYTMVLFLLSILWVVALMIYSVYSKNQIKTQTYLYTLSFNDENQSYLGFLDTGNQAYYEGYPLIFISSSLHLDCQVVGTMRLKRLYEEDIPIVLIERMMINQQEFSHVYAGIIDDLSYDCLLHTSYIRGGI